MGRPRTPIAFLSSLRNRFQLALFVLTLAIGLQFYFFVQQAVNSGPITIHRPAGVEGFLPIGALLGWKQFLTTGVWDPVHPAAMVMLCYAAAISFRHLCPYGALMGILRLSGNQFPFSALSLPAKKILTICKRVRHMSLPHNARSRHLNR